MKNKRPYQALEVAKYIISRCTENERPINNKQLQTILQALQLNYVNRGERLFYDKIVAADGYCVIPRVYNYYAGWGSNPIVWQYTDDKMADEDKARIDSIIGCVYFLDVNVPQYSINKANSMLIMLYKKITLAPERFWRKLKWKR